MNKINQSSLSLQFPKQSEKNHIWKNLGHQNQNPKNPKPKHQQISRVLFIIMCKKITLGLWENYNQTLETEDEEEEEDDDDVMGDDVISFSSPYWIMLKMSGLVM